MTTLQTLRLPRGLWADLEDTVIQQDRQFLTDVARSLGLPVPEVLRKCLGTGAPQAVLIGSPNDEAGSCPWWSRTDDGCWRPCGRLRLSPLSPCQLHTHAAKGPALCLGSDRYLTTLPTLNPILYEGELFWVSGDPDIPVYREDGTIEPDREFKFIDHQGQRICVRVLKLNQSLSQ